MHSLSVLLFAFVASSYAFPSIGFTALEVRKDRNGTHSNGGNPTKQACKQISKLTHLTELAANQTKLDELVAKGKMNATEVDQLKAKAAEATTKLQTMESNTTLTNECAVINAEQKTVQECKQMNKLQKLANLASNTTALDAMVAKKELNSTEVDKLKEKIQSAQTKLQTLSSNTTLTEFCVQRQEGKGTADADGELLLTSATGRPCANKDAGTSSSAGAAGSATADQSSSNSAGSMGMTIATLPYILLPTVAATIVLML
jgi:hypothetical protein